MSTQHQKIMALLKHNQWVCTNSFYAQYIADPRKRLEELRKEGIKMEWRWCQNPEHNHKGHSKEWKLLEEIKYFKGEESALIKEMREIRERAEQEKEIKNFNSTASLF